MRHISWTAGVLLAIGSAGAADPPVEKLDVKPRVIPAIEWTMPAGTPAEQVKAITDRQKQLQDAFFKKYKDAKSQDEKRRLAETEYPEPDAPARLLLEIATKN